MQAVFAFFNTSWVRTILITFHILILFGTNKWAYSVICQFWPMFSLNFFLASRKYVHYLHYYLAEQHIARANLDKLGYLVCFENNSFISHISPKKVPKSWQNIMCKMKIHCRMNLVVKIENPSSNLLKICSYISSFLHCRLIQTKTSFLLELTLQKWFSITYKANMKTTRQSFQMIAHCLFTSIDSNEKSWEIRMRVIAG